jgi:hypothetical protein
MHVYNLDSQAQRDRLKWRTRMTKQTVIFSILVGVIACLAMAQPNATQTKTTNNPKAESGRWQIVNGTPEQASNIMLLDTQTGDSWITCFSSDGGTMWCLILKTNSSAINKAHADKSPVQCLRWENGVCVEIPKP